MFNKFNEFELTITGQGGFYMDESEGYNPDDAEENQPACVPKGKGIFKPSNWKIIGRNPAPEHGHLLVFYMLPQNASRNHSKGDITDKSPDGPNCEELYIEFVRNFKFSLVKSNQNIFFLFRTSRTTLFCLLAIHQPLPPPQQRLQHGQRPPPQPLQRPPSQHRPL